MAEIPDWAMVRACELADQMGPDSRGDMHQDALRAFARYITAHEEPPVDPLLIEAREIVADYEPIPHVGVGDPMDYTAEVQIALAALKRGIELAGKRSVSIPPGGIGYIAEASDA